MKTRTLDVVICLIGLAVVLLGVWGTLHHGCQ